MEKRIALVGIIIWENESAPRLNQILHEYAEDIVGRMGIPHLEDNTNVISIVMNSTETRINALSGKIGMLKGVSSKVIYGKKN